MMKLPVYLLIIILLFGGCGPKNISTDPSKVKKKSDYIFYPPLPNVPKYQYLTTFSSSQDIVKKKSKFFDFVAGDEKEKPQVIQKAYGVAIYDGIIYVCDVGNGFIETLDLKNRIFGYIGYKGAGKLVKPINLIIDKVEKVLYVADNGRKQVLCFSLTGDYMNAIGTKEELRPVAVAYHGEKLFICDIGHHRIRVYNKISGKFLYDIGEPGSGDGQLFHPTNIWIMNERLYVSDTTNFRVQVFDLSGKFINKFGQAGRRPGDFARGKGIAVDRDNRIYVVDAAFENVQVFSQDFKLLLFLFGPGRERHNINLPAGISIDYDNIQYFKKYISPNFEAQYLVFVTSNYGYNKVNVYAFGKYQK